MVNLSELYPDGVPEWRLKEIKQNQEQIDEDFDFELYCTGEI